MYEKLIITLDSLVNEKVNVVDNEITSCCILDLVLWKQNRIYSFLRSGFIWSEVEKIEFPSNHIPIIYLKKNRAGRQFLTKKEMKEIRLRYF